MHLNYAFTTSELQFIFDQFDHDEAEAVKDQLRPFIQERFRSMYRIVWNLPPFSTYLAHHCNGMLYNELDVYYHVEQCWIILQQEEEEAHEKLDQVPVHVQQAAAFLSSCAHDIWNEYQYPLMNESILDFPDQHMCWCTLSCDTPVSLLLERRRDHKTSFDHQLFQAPQWKQIMSCLNHGGRVQTLVFILAMPLLRLVVVGQHHHVRDEIVRFLSECFQWQQRRRENENDEDEDEARKVVLVCSGYRRSSVFHIQDLDTEPTASASRIVCLNVGSILVESSSSRLGASSSDLPLAGEISPRFRFQSLACPNSNAASTLKEEEEETTNSSSSSSKGSFGTLSFYHEPECSTVDWNIVTPGSSSLESILRLELGPVIGPVSITTRRSSDDDGPITSCGVQLLVQINQSTRFDIQLMDVCSTQVYVTSHDLTAHEPQVYQFSKLRPGRRYRYSFPHLTHGHDEDHPHQASLDDVSSRSIFPADVLEGTLETPGAWASKERSLASEERSTAPEERSSAAERARILVLGANRAAEHTRISPWKVVMDKLLGMPWHGVDLVIHTGGQVPHPDEKTTCMPLKEQLGYMKNPRYSLQETPTTRERSSQKIDRRCVQLEYQKYWNMKSTRQVLGKSSHQMICSREDLHGGLGESSSDETTLWSATVQSMAREYQCPWTTTSSIGNPTEEEDKDPGLAPPERLQTTKKTKKKKTENHPTRYYLDGGLPTKKKKKDDDEASTTRDVFQQLSPEVGLLTLDLSFQLNLISSRQWQLINATMKKKHLRALIVATPTPVLQESTLGEQAQELLDASLLEFFNRCLEWRAKFDTRELMFVSSNSSSSSQGLMSIYRETTYETFFTSLSVGSFTTGKQSKTVPTTPLLQGKACHGKLDFRHDRVVPERHFGLIQVMMTEEHDTHAKDELESGATPPTLTEFKLQFIPIDD